MATQQQIIKWDESKWLMVSSLLFLPSAYLSYKREYYMQCYGLLFTIFSSINYWRKATNGTRRAMDLACSKFASGIFIYNGFIYLHGYGTISWSNLLFAVYCYYKSNQLYEAKNTTWLFYHMLFHMSSGIQACVITYYLP